MSQLCTNGYNRCKPAEQVNTGNKLSWHIIDISMVIYVLGFLYRSVKQSLNALQSLYTLHIQKTINAQHYDSIT